MAKALKDMTVAEATASGQTTEYNNLVNNILTGTQSGVTYNGPSVAPTINKSAANYYSPVTTNDLSSSNTPVVPPTLPSTNNYTGVGAGASAYIAGNPPPVAPTPTPKTAAQTATEAYAGLTTVNSEQILKDTQDAASLKEKGDTARKLKSRIEAINAQAESAQRQLESDAGTGKDITGQFLGRQQQEVQRQAAIQTLPLTAEYQAALGDYQAAQDTVNQLYTAKLADAKAQYDYKTKAIEIAYNMASADEKKVLEAAQRKEDMAFDKEKMQLNFSYDKELAKYKAGLDSTGSTVGLTPDQSLIINTILSSNKFTKDQKQYLVDAAKSGMDLSYIVKNQAKTAMSGTTATKVEAQELSLSSLERLNQQMKDFYAAGGKSNLFTGNMEKVIGKLGAVNDPKLRALATDIEASLQTYRNAISGTAYSNQEGQAIASIFPGIDKTEGLNESILNSRISGIKSLVDSAYSNVLGPDVYSKINGGGKKDEQTQSQFSDILKDITIDGQTAYIPRSVWSTLGARQDALLAEAKADGYTLLVK